MEIGPLTFWTAFAGNVSPDLLRGFAARRLATKNTKRARVRPMKSWHEVDADFESRVERYREAARLLRSSVDTIRADLRSDLLDVARNLEDLANIIEQLRFDMTETA